MTVGDQPSGGAGEGKDTATDAHVGKVQLHEEKKGTDSLAEAESVDIMRSDLPAGLLDKLRQRELGLWKPGSRHAKTRCVAHRLQLDLRACMLLPMVVGITHTAPHPTWPTHPHVTTAGNST